MLAWRWVDLVSCKIDFRCMCKWNQFWFDYIGLYFMQIQENWSLSSVVSAVYVCFWVINIASVNCQPFFLIKVHYTFNQNVVSCGLCHISFFYDHSWIISLNWLLLLFNCYSINTIVLLKLMPPFWMKRYHKWSAS